MKGKCREFDILPQDPVIQHSRGEFTVLPAPPFEIFIESVHREGIRHPEGKITGPYAPQSLPPAGKASGHKRRPQGVLPVHEPGFKGGKIHLPSAEYLDCLLLRDEYTGALGKMAGLGGSFVVSDEILMEDHVSIHQKNVTSLRPGHGLIADHGRTETPVGLPDVMDGDGRVLRQAVHTPLCFFPRAVVGDENLLRGPRLPQCAQDRELQGVRPVIGGDDQGNLHFRSSS